MDAFFASVEQLDNPELKGNPVAVGGSAKRGVVAAASYEAREYGVRSAMPSIIAKQKCPALIFVKPRFRRYKEVSQQIRNIFSEYTDLVEPLSLDEAFLDVTINKYNEPSAVKIAKQIKAKILAITGLTASAGISVNKFLAKMASDHHKPDGCTLILPEKAEAYVNQLPIEKFFGIGKVTAKKMNALGIQYGKDLRNYSEVDLIRMFGKVGHYYYHICRGIDERPVTPHRKRKSISAETTFATDLEDFAEITTPLENLVSRITATAAKNKIKGRTITVKVRFDDFKTITRQRSFDIPTNNHTTVITVAIDLLKFLQEEFRPIRLLGVGLGGLTDHKNDQIDLFSSY